MRKHPVWKTGLLVLIHIAGAAHANQLCEHACNRLTDCAPAASTDARKPLTRVVVVSAGFVGSATVSGQQRWIDATYTSTRIHHRFDPLFV